MRFVGALPVVDRVNDPLVPLNKKTLVVGGLFVSNQMFFGPVEKSRMFVAKSALIGTLI
jgi:hypothetical protein